MRRLSVLSLIAAMAWRWMTCLKTTCGLTSNGIAGPWTQAYPGMLMAKEMNAIATELAQKVVWTDVRFLSDRPGKNASRLRRHLWSKTLIFGVVCLIHLTESL